ncbi:unknown protein [Seminavis robusta]|uniref:Uncharacterized protein n=1 Tax=Seminavis robusta TaxID=568900 RepID=A0A9N8HZV4_9STRA|nr:unknown protein [Seminavis robusta]|eukprot:Sro4176_g353280.1 n/a (152) ;mRNA; r:1250-1705
MVNPGTRLRINQGEYQHQVAVFCRPCPTSPFVYCYVELTDSSQVRVPYQHFDFLEADGSLHQGRQLGARLIDYEGLHMDEIARMGAWTHRSYHQDRIIEGYRSHERKMMVKTIKNLNRELKQERSDHETLKKQCRELYKTMVEEDQEGKEE